MNLPLILNLLVFLALLFGLAQTRHTTWSLAKKVLLALVLGVAFGVALHTLMIERYIATDSAGFGPHLDLFVDLAKDTEMGPLALARRVESMQALVADAQARGGSLVCGGERLGDQGFFFAPTVLTGMPDDSRVMTEEPFGPVVPITRFKISMHAMW